MLGFLCRVELISGSCWWRRRSVRQSWSVKRRKRKRKLKKRKRNKYDILSSTFRYTPSCTHYGLSLIIFPFSTLWQKKAVSLKESEVNGVNVSAELKEERSLSLTETSTNSLSKGQVNWAYQHDTTMSDSDSDTGYHGDDSITQVSDVHSGKEKGPACGSGTHSIVLDISTTSFVDTVAAKTLKNVCGCQDLCVLALI